MAAQAAATAMAAAAGRTSLTGCSAIRDRGYIRLVRFRTIRRVTAVTLRADRSSDQTKTPATMAGVFHFKMVQAGGLEPPTSGSTDQRSNQLSYACMRPAFEGPVQAGGN